MAIDIITPQIKGERREREIETQGTGLKSHPKDISCVIFLLPYLDPRPLVRGLTIITKEVTCLLIKICHLITNLKKKKIYLQNMNIMKNFFLCQL